jgi:hypothetical protein
MDLLKSIEQLNERLNNIERLLALNYEKTMRLKKTAIFSALQTPKRLH